MELGAFSVSLAVKDLTASRAFYEKLGFQAVAGDPAQNWLVLRNGTTNIGLFQGMFDKNILTFNPGWSQTATPLLQFTDVRELQRRLEQQPAPPDARRRSDARPGERHAAGSGRQPDPVRPARAVRNDADVTDHRGPRSCRVAASRRDDLVVHDVQADELRPV